jgi:predicted nucleic acid-binding protein
MIVVSDTGPLNYLALIGHLNVLAAAHGDADAVRGRVLRFA